MLHCTSYHMAYGYTARSVMYHIIRDGLLATLTIFTRLELPRVHVYYFYNVAKHHLSCTSSTTPVS